MVKLENLEAKFAGAVENFCREDRSLLKTAVVWMYTGFGGWDMRYIVILSDAFLLCSPNVESSKQIDFWKLDEMTANQSREAVRLDRKVHLRNETLP